ncbi:MAG: dockerin type I repeat-containing protein, partial [Clostridia bacterium]|nr:dockerin type I repeat-containing protein [Clostridia bacterium]
SEEEWNAINCEEYNLYGDDTVIHYNSHLIEYGDVNGDAVISAKDSMQAQRYAIKLDELTPAQINAADVDKDGKVTSKDALYILRCSINLAVLPIEN